MQGSQVIAFVIGGPAWLLCGWGVLDHGLVSGLTQKDGASHAPHGHYWQ